MVTPPLWICKVVIPPDDREFSIDIRRNFLDKKWFYDIEINNSRMVIQRRTSEDVDFYRNWADYKSGFGNLMGNFWIGNDILHILTNSPRILRVELEAWDGTKGYAQYSEFQVANEALNYRLSVQGFSGNVSYDVFGSHNGYAFTTFNRDNDIKEDENCALQYRGGWWYYNCFQCNPNGLYMTYSVGGDIKAMSWGYFPDAMSIVTPLKATKMIIR
ncbi:ficolin-1-like [Pecten maximus]|uniref:ficolin-1-like n=1 Tax=Pecten maximus TaxID=6579 RepID=UPI0014580ED3|nr:ficolin-1-like [Pecten maximus]